MKTPDADAWISRHIGSLIYCGEGEADSLVGVVTADGFIDCEDAEQDPRMRYYPRDHLGSVRVIAQDRNAVFADGTRHWTQGERYQHFGARAYDPVTCVFMQIDPLAEKYYAFTPYGYCAGNPVRFQDPDGADGKDKIVGIIVGVVTNIIPGSSGLRDGYTPENPSDYNDGLRSADIACLVVGGSMTVGGAAAIAAGEAGAAAGVVAVASVAGAPEGIAVAAAGATTAAAGELAIGAGAYVMAQAMDNSAGGYDRGKVSGRNERHGDGGRSLSSKEAQIAELKKQMEGAPKKIRESLAQKIKNITEYAHKRRSGEEHSRGNKR